MFSTQKKTNAVGLDMGTSSTKLVKLKKITGNAYALELCLLINTPLASAEYIDLTKEALLKSKMSGQKIAASLEDPSVRIRKLEMPGMPAADLKEAIKWKMRDHVDGTIEENNIMSSLIEETVVGGTKKQVLIGYAVKKQAVKDRIDLIQKLGVHAISLEPMAVTLAACLEKVYPSENQWVAAVELGHSKTIMVINGRGKFHFSRPLPGITLSDAAKDTAAFNRKLAAEIQNTLDTFSVTFHIDKIDRLFLSGGGASINELPEYLSKNLAIETGLLNPFIGIEISDALKERIDDKPYLYSLAVGLALMEV